MNNIKIQQWLIGIFSALLIVTLMIVASVETKKSKEFRVNLLDLGGQEIYHATHQIFLTLFH